MFVRGRNTILVFGGTRENHKNFSQDNQPLEQELNQGPLGTQCRSPKHLFIMSNRKSEKGGGCDILQSIYQLVLRKARTAAF
jgi:hypothetical protein